MSLKYNLVLFRQTPDKKRLFYNHFHTLYCVYPNDFGFTLRESFRQAGPLLVWPILILYSYNNFCNHYLENNDECRSDLLAHVGFKMVFWVDQYESQQP